MVRQYLFSLAVLFSILPITAYTAAGQVFFGGYHYPVYHDPSWYHPWGPDGNFGQYYDPRPQLRVKVEPEDEVDEAAVFVDGAYAGVADDFDGDLRGLILPEGRHTIALFFEGFKTARFDVHLKNRSTFTLRHTMQRLPAGERSAPPPRANGGEEGEG
jgi:hypothetical protein